MLTAAALKGHQLATEPVTETSLFTSRWFLIIVVEFELLFGLWLLAGVHPRWTWLGALFCFSGFACVSFSKAVSGEASCGCFGSVTVNPWYTLVLDVGGVAALLACRPFRDKSTLPMAAAISWNRLAGIATVFLLVGLPVAFAMASYRAATTDEEERIYGSSQYVLLEPEKWTGTRLPLLDHIDIGDKLGQGNWVVFLYDYDCSKCQEIIVRSEAIAQELAERGSRLRVALIEMPPYHSRRRDFTAERSGCVWGYLDETKEWFATTPVKIVLKEGVVRNVMGPAE